MRSKRQLLKVTAVLSSLSLMGAFVAYRAGALDSLIPGRSGREVLSGTKSRTLVTPLGPDATLPGSKSDAIVMPSPRLATEISPSDPIEPSNVLMYSSKSAVLVQDPFATAVGAAVDEALPQPPSEPFQKVNVTPQMMGGSKSFTIVPSSTLTSDASLEP